ncbi:MAG: methyl-accepting chemotaxis protein, partial [Proteobacteria bacterium]|nr:methyl-accepting chemotaxis protein [Pseudomonadota bacterium]
FENLKGYLCQVAYKPVVYEDKNIGFLMIVKRIQDSYIKNVSKLLGTNINIFLKDQFSIGDFPDYKQFDYKGFSNKVENWDIKKQSLAFTDITINGKDFFQCGLPIYTDNIYTGSVITLYSKDTVKKNTWQIVNLLIILATCCIVISFPVTIIFSNSLTKPIRNVVQGIKDVAEGDGDLTKRLEISSILEIGELTGWFNTFIEKLHGIIRGIKENTEKLGSSAIKLSDISTIISDNAINTAEKSNTVAQATTQMSLNMDSVASAMEETSTNVSIVAASATQLTENINDIVDKSDKSCKIIQEAVLQTQKTSTRVEELGTAACKINTVTEAITEISEQINLLSLNATIEAARAGEAGKGFAVVANEIKDLAKQTSNATLTIKKQIDGIQIAAAGTIKDIQGIRTVTNQANDIVSSIAICVETQSKTTEEIDTNVNQASLGIKEINEMITQNSQVSTDINQDISEVNSSSKEMSDSCLTISTSANDLKEMVLVLQHMISNFKV